MNERIARILEFDKVREMLCEQAASGMGKALAQSVQPASEYEAVCRLLDETAEAETQLFRLGHSPVDPFPDVRAALKKSGATYALGTRELLDIARAMRAARFCRASLRPAEGEEEGIVCRMAQNLHVCRAVEEEIFRCILAEDEIADTASARLNALRRQIRACGDRVRDKLNSLLHSSTYKNCLQESIVTMRNGRYVVPVKQEYRSMVPGLLHDQSGSGATLFIEPMAVVEIGNELKKLQSEEQEEIQRILSQLTAQVAPEAAALEASLSAMAELDVIFARAQLSRMMGAVRPKLNKDGFLRILAGRHPLIDKDKVVPIDIWLGRDFKTLIITGPNTGGKTVTLKTVGLFTLMTQSGLFLPAIEGTEMSVFREVFADIGDEQSIEQSLSTFSSHMKTIVSILEQADDESLVLVDELGSGTDPVEGAALAMSILEELHGRRTVTLATTHYSELKAFALTREGMENASMEFDVKTLRPTYRLFIGIPGKSNAFEISRKLGLPDRLIQQAQTYLDGKNVSFEDAISNAESQRRIAEEERRQAEEARAQLYRLRDEAEKERKKLNDQRDKLLKKARDEARQTVNRARMEAEHIIGELKAVKDSADESSRSRAIQKARDGLRKSEAAMGDTLKSPIVSEKASLPAPKKVEVGQRVHVLSIDNDATVLSLPDSKGEVYVQAGIMKLSVKLADLRVLEEKKPVYTATASVQKGEGTAALEIDVRGMTVDEAILEVDKYIDNAFLSGIHEVSIIHGKGTGALRAGLQSYLKRHKHVAQMRLGRYGEGEAGVTVVTLK